MTANVLFRLSPIKVLGLYVVLDIVCVGMGMGVPFFNILFGFVVGWYLVRWMHLGGADTILILWRLIAYGAAAASITMLCMAVLWSWTVPLVIDPSADLAQTGIPMVLYEPRASMIGWLVLMVAVSPFLQWLTIVFAGNVTVLLSTDLPKAENRAPR